MNQHEMTHRNHLEWEGRRHLPLEPGTGKGLITISLAKLHCPEMAGREEAMQAVMHQLLSIAHRKMRRTRERLGLETCELVNEMVLKLYRQRPIEWENREHFYATCSKWMSQIVIDQWRHATAIRNGGGQERIALTDSLLSIDRDLVTLLALREALDRLAKLDARKSLIAELRYLWGMTIEEVAVALDIPPIRVKRDWKVARMWLEDALSPLVPPGGQLQAVA